MPALMIETKARAKHLRKITLESLEAAVDNDWTHVIECAREMTLLADALLMDDQTNLRLAPKSLPPIDPPLDYEAPNVPD